MAEILITVDGEGAVPAAKELLAIPGISGSLVPEGEPKREGTLATVAAIVGITVGIVEIGERIHKWYKKCKQSRSGKTFEVLVEGPDGRLLLEDATIDEICQVLKALEK